MKNIKEVMSNIPKGVKIAGGVALGIGALFIGASVIKSKNKDNDVEIPKDTDAIISEVDTIMADADKIIADIESTDSDASKIIADLKKSE